MDLKKIQNYIQKILQNKQTRRTMVWVLLLLGLLMMIIQLPSDSRRQKQVQSDTDCEEMENKQGASYLNDREYTANMEKRLSDILSEMEGVGRVKVMITLKESSENILEKDVESTEESSQENNSISNSRTMHEDTVYYGQNTNETWSSENESGTKPYVRKQKAPMVEGVMVAAEGGDHPIVKKNIAEAVQALFGVESHKIRIVKKKS